MNSTVIIILQAAALHSKLYSNTNYKFISTEGEWGTVEVAACIAGPIILLCIVTVAFFYFNNYQNKRNMHHHVGLCEDSIEAPDHPILNGVSLKHMIEMTTSGSGSGK